MKLDKKLLLSLLLLANPATSSDGTALGTTSENNNNITYSLDDKSYNSTTSPPLDDNSSSSTDINLLDDTSDNQLNDKDRAFNMLFAHLEYDPLDDDMSYNPLSIVNQTVVSQKYPNLSKEFKQFLFQEGKDNFLEILRRGQLENKLQNLTRKRHALISYVLSKIRIHDIPLKEQVYLFKNEEDNDIWERFLSQKSLVKLKSRLERVFVKYHDIRESIKFLLDANLVYLDRDLGTNFTALKNLLQLLEEYINDQNKEYTKDVFSIILDEIQDCDILEYKIFVDILGYFNSEINSPDNETKDGLERAFDNVTKRRQTILSRLREAILPSPVLSINKDALDYNEFMSEIYALDNICFTFINLAQYYYEKTT